MKDDEGGKMERKKGMMNNREGDAERVEKEAEEEGDGEKWKRGEKEKKMK